MSEQLTNIFGDTEVSGESPDCGGDYYKVSDRQQDFNYTMEKVYDALLNISDNPSSDHQIISGGVVSDNGDGTIDISACVAMGYNHDDKKRFISLPALSNVSLPSGYNDGRQIWIILKHDFKLGTSTRTHKVSGTYHYQLDDTYYGDSSGLEGATTDDLFTDSDPSGDDVILGSFTMTGTTYVDQDVRSPQYQPKLTGIIRTQSDFNAIIERTGANTYKIKDEYTHIELKYLSGGYLCYGGTSFLSGGDTWGYVETNNCLELKMNTGAYLNVGDNQFYIETDTNYCVMKDITVYAPGSSTASIEYTFLLNADYVTYENCIIKNRLSDTNMTGFMESSTSSHNDTASYINCKVVGLDGTLYRGGFGYCVNLKNCFEDGGIVKIKPKWTSARQVGIDFNVGAISTVSIDVLTNYDIAYFDGTNEHLRAYRFDGNVFAQVGSNLSISGAAPRIAAMNDTDIAFLDYANDTLRTYRFNGSTWSAVGNSLSLSGIGIGGIAFLCNDGTYDYVAVVEDGLEILRTYKFDGTDWTQEGNSLSISGVGAPSIARLNETDIAFLDVTEKDLRTYRFDGSDWAQIGNDLNISSLSVPAIGKLNSTDILCRNFSDNDLTVYRFNGTNWAQIGNKLDINGGGSTSMSAINGNDIAYIDDGNDDLRVYRLDYEPN